MRLFEAATARLWCALALAGACVVPTAGAGDAVEARVKTDRVNLRARAEATSEVVGQVSVDERLPVQQVQEEWVQVVPPDRIDLWVHRDFVKDNASTVDRLNIRAGAGINYSVVGTLERGARIDVRGQFGEWLKIAPSNSLVWISRELVDLEYAGGRAPVTPPAAPVASGQPPAPEAAGAMGALELGPVRAPAATAGGAVSAPPDLRLVPLEGQGRLVQREGELKPAPFVFGRPSKFRLVTRDGAQLATLCYVRGNSEQLTSLLNQRLLVRGREYWVQGVRQPVIVLERIERRPSS